MRRRLSWFAPGWLRLDTISILQINSARCRKAEKALKGFLASRDHDLERTHDLRRLIQVAARYDHSFASSFNAGITLTPYATAYRYPGESATIEPSRAEFVEAVELATNLVKLVLSLLPHDAQPIR
jgi:HEPN domain-containing protein